MSLAQLALAEAGLLKVRRVVVGARMGRLGRCILGVGSVVFWGWVWVRVGRYLGR